MPGKPKSDWSIKNEELKARLPKGFKGTYFIGAKKDGKLDEKAAGEIITEKKWDDKQDVIIAFLNHQKDKPAGKKRGAKKQKTKENGQNDPKLLSKRTYKGLTYDDFDKLIAMLTEMKKDAKAKKIEAAKAKKEDAEKELKDLMAK